MVRFPTIDAIHGYNADLISGDLIRVGSNELVTRNPDDWKKILAVRTKYCRGDFYDCLRVEPGIDNILSQRDDVLHSSLRA